MFPATSQRKHHATGRGSSCGFPCCCSCCQCRKSIRRVAATAGATMVAGVFLLLLLLNTQLDITAVDPSSLSSSSTPPQSQQPLKSSRTLPTLRSASPFVAEEGAAAKCCSSATWLSSPECASARFSIELHRPSPVFAPRFIGKALVEEHMRGRTNDPAGNAQDPTAAARNTNDVAISAEDLERATHNVVLMANVTPSGGRQFTSHRSAPAGSVSSRACKASVTKDNVEQLSQLLFNNLANFIVNITKDVAPVVADYGCRFGPAISNGLRRSSVVCFIEERDDLAVSSAGTCRDEEEMAQGTAPGAAASNSTVRPCNALRVVVPVEVERPRCPTKKSAHAAPGKEAADASPLHRGGFLGPTISPLYSSCNIFSVSIISSALVLNSDPADKEEEKQCGGGESGAARMGWENSPEAVVELVSRTLPISGAVLAIVPRVSDPWDCALFRAAVDERMLSQRSSTHVSPSSPPPGSHQTTTNVEYACDRIATISRDDVSHAAGPSRALFDVFLLETLYSRRPCQKSWNAPFVQWDRAVDLIYAAGRVKFHVRDLKAERQQQNQQNPSVNAPKSMERTIHPLQYIPSLNVDTLLNLGLSMKQRVALLGSMLATPRYSDPLPHNWIFAGGGQVLRVDKIDLRFDRDVDESLNYWGVSTRGYVHLLAHHLCLPIGVDGLPTAFHELPKSDAPPPVGSRCEGSESCRASCRDCVTLCSYLPKGSTPCPACMSCGNCMLSMHSCRGAQPDGNGRVAMNSPAEENEKEKERSRVWPRCSQTYSSYHAARRVWDGWRRSDSQHPINL